jgi:hypothetical protein
MLAVIICRTHLFIMKKIIKMYGSKSTIRAAKPISSHSGATRAETSAVGSDLHCLTWIANIKERKFTSFHPL